MTTQAPDIFGRDIYVSVDTEDADDVFSEASGVQLVKQDLRHRLMVADVLWPGGDDDGFLDLTAQLGATAGAVIKLQTRIKRVCTKDQRIQSAIVIVTESTSFGLTTASINITCQTALGPFRLAFTLDPSATTDSQVQIIEAQ